jgi:hypothetical protein
MDLLFCFVALADVCGLGGVVMLWTAPKRSMMRHRITIAVHMIFTALGISFWNA